MPSTLPSRLKPGQAGGYFLDCLLLFIQLNLPAGSADSRIITGATGCTCQHRGRRSPNEKVRAMSRDLTTPRDVPSHMFCPHRWRRWSTSPWSQRVRDLDGGICCLETTTYFASEFPLGHVFRLSVLIESWRLRGWQPRQTEKEVR